MIKIEKSAFYLDGDKFRDIKDLVIGEEGGDFIIDEKTNLGKIIFEAITFQQGNKGYGKISCVTTKELQKLENLPAESYGEFIEYFSEITGRELCERLKQDFEKRDGMQKIIENLKREHEVEFHYTQAVSEMMEEPLDYLGRFFSFSTEQSKKMSLTQIEKLLGHQTFVLLKLLQMAEEVPTKTINLEQEMKCHRKGLDSVMPLSWHEPTVKIKIDDEIYSIWYEFSAPYPFYDKEEKVAIMRKLRDQLPMRKFIRKGIFVPSALNLEWSEIKKLQKTLRKDTTKRFDIIVKKGDFDSMFPKPDYEKIEEMDEEQFFDLPKHFFKEMKIDLLIECKEQEFGKWKNDVENQIIPYMETYKPNKMVVISAFSVPENVISKLKEKWITTIAPFGFENVSYEKERELKNVIKT